METGPVAALSSGFNAFSRQMQGLSRIHAGITKFNVAMDDMLASLDTHRRFAPPR
jgi:hypothetical protein